MPNILIIGATGYIGLALAESLTRSGSHIVYGLARTPEKATLLAKHEVLPVAGSVEDSATYLSLIEEKHIDVVVDTSGAFKEAYKILQDLKDVAERRKTISAGVSIPKLGFIYVSGIWVHGSSNEPVNDLMPVGTKQSPTQPPSIVAWRPDLEREILAASDVLDVAIVRPALVYGRSGAIWSSLFKAVQTAAKNGDKSVEIPLEPKSKPGLVHVDDVASALHAVVEKLPLISGTGVYPVFDIATSQESMIDIIEAAAEQFRFDGEVKLVGCGGDAFMEAMSTSINASSSRAKDLLAWQPKRFGMVQNIQVFAKSWTASQ